MERGNRPDEAQTLHPIYIIGITREQHREKYQRRRRQGTTGKAHRRDTDPTNTEGNRKGANRTIEHRFVSIVAFAKKKKKNKRETTIRQR